MKLLEVQEILSRCEGAYAEGTLRCYRFDLEKFRSWCSARGATWLPAEPAIIAGFLNEEAPRLSIATLRRRLNAIRFAHRVVDLPCSADHSEVLLSFRRAARTKLVRPKQSMGLTADLLETIIAACPPTLEGMRDAALVSVGYDTLCRRSELSAIRLADLAPDYTSVCIPRSKMDPFGKGRVAYLSPRSTRHVRLWLKHSGISEGHLFRRVRGPHIWPAPLASQSIGILIKRVAKRAGLGAEAVSRLSGHSMRVGAAQDMMVAGIDSLGIMQAGGWQSFSVLARYVENASAERLHQRRWQQLAHLS